MLVAVLAVDELSELALTLLSDKEVAFFLLAATRLLEFELNSLDLLVLFPQEASASDANRTAPMVNLFFN
ncbi:hypothetical protein WP50_01375 [Lactiplantibacillus plantarum]|nr:hypothetical protein WP50_01375 [Lactiplantibacillus plantarum]